MKKLFKFLGFGLGGMLVFILAALTWVKTALPDVGPPPDLKVERSEASVARGKYLAHHVMLCMDCHSQRDWSKFSGPMIAGTEGMGGEVFDRSFGFPGRYVAPNITPFGLKDWTDGEIFRAITSGVSKDGRALFNIMPHHQYGKCDPKDVESVIAYIRGIQPIANVPEKSVSDFPMNFIINTLPKKAAFHPKPDSDDELAYGKYMATASGCIECHTKQDKGQIVGEEFAGGFEFPLPNGSLVRSANLTPDKETGMGYMSKEAFVRRFKAYGDSAYHSPACSEKGAFQSVMPWTMYAGMEEKDLAAIFVYLQSLKPVSNQVVKFSPEGLAKN